MIVPRTIDGEEVLIRGVLTPIFYSSSKSILKREAFLPPPIRNDVSLLRLEYTNDNFCKNHAASLVINGSSYCGLASFKEKHVRELALNGSFDFTVEVKATPIDIAGAIVADDAEVNESSPGLPMHADMIYSIAIEKGEVQTKLRRFAEALLKIANYFPDPNPKNIDWSGDRLGWQPIQR
jgi:hypothetical protein